jgi:hypothetical protein
MGGVFGAKAGMDFVGFAWWVRPLSSSLAGAGGSRRKLGLLLALVLGLLVQVTVKSVLVDVIDDIVGYPERSAWAMSMGVMVRLTSNLCSCPS